MDNLKNQPLEPYLQNIRHTVKAFETMKGIGIDDGPTAEPVYAAESSNDTATIDEGLTNNDENKTDVDETVIGPPTMFNFEVSQFQNDFIVYMIHTIVWNELI